MTIVHDHNEKVIIDASLGTVHKIRLIYKSYYGENWKFFMLKNSYNILHETGVRVSMGLFTFLKFSFLSIFSIVTLIN